MPDPSVATTPTAQALAGIELFAELSPAELERLALSTVVQEHPRGGEIFAEGQEATGFYGVVSGRVKVAKLSPAGKEQILHVLGPGEVLGEAAVFAGTSFPASAQALEVSRLVFLPRARFRELIASDPDLSLHMLALLSRRLRTFAGRIEALSLKEVPARLAAHFLMLSGGGERRRFELDLPKGMLAGLIGTIPETLSRALKRLDEEGLVRTEGRKVEILDATRLAELASGAWRI